MMLAVQGIDAFIERTQILRARVAFARKGPDGGAWSVATAPARPR